MELTDNESTKLWEDAMKKYLDRKYYPQIIILENKRLKVSKQKHPD